MFMVKLNKKQNIIIIINLKNKKQINNKSISIQKIKFYEIITNITTKINIIKIKYKYEKIRNNKKMFKKIKSCSLIRILTIYIKIIYYS